MMTRIMLCDSTRRAGKVRRAVSNGVMLVCMKTTKGAKADPKKTMGKKTEVKGKTAAKPLAKAKASKAATPAGKKARTPERRKAATAGGSQKQASA